MKDINIFPQPKWNQKIQKPLILTTLALFSALILNGCSSTESSSTKQPIKPYANEQGSLKPIKKTCYTVETNGVIDSRHNEEICTLIIKDLYDNTFSCVENARHFIDQGTQMNCTLIQIKDEAKDEAKPN